MQSIAQQTNSCTGMKGWPNKRFVFNLAFCTLHCPVHCTAFRVAFRALAATYRALCILLFCLCKNPTTADIWHSQLCKSEAGLCRPLQFSLVILKFNLVVFWQSNLDEIVDEKEEWKQALRWQWLTTRSSTCLLGQYDPCGEQVRKYYLRKKQR